MSESSKVEFAGYFLPDGSDVTALEAEKSAIPAKAHRLYLLALVRANRTGDRWHDSQAEVWLSRYESAYADYWAWARETGIQACHVYRDSPGTEGHPHYTPLA